MLLELRLENFKSFKNLSDFSLVPHHGLKDLEYSLKREKEVERSRSACALQLLWDPMPQVSQTSSALWISLKIWF
jgi:hypothetical protein